MSGAAELQDKLDRSREQLLEAIAWLPDEALLQPDAAGRWSVADLLSLLTAWEAELVTALMRLGQGKKPGRLLDALARREAYDEARVGETHGRELGAIFTDWQQVRVQLEEWLADLRDRDLNQPGRYTWLGGRSLAQLIEEVILHREARYLPDLERFAQTWREAHGNGRPSVPPGGSLEDRDGDN
ncbi:MAG: DinB family protein [Anaerolineae bacterium]